MHVPNLPVCEASRKHLAAYSLNALEAWSASGLACLARARQTCTQHAAALYQCVDNGEPRCGAEANLVGTDKPAKAEVHSWPSALAIGGLTCTAGTGVSHTPCCVAYGSQTCINEVRRPAIPRSHPGLPGCPGDQVKS